MKKLLLAALLLAFACTPRTSVTSPDGKIAVSFDPQAFAYSVTVDGQPFLEPSPLGLSALEADLCEGFVLKGSSVKSERSTWTQPWGENKTVQDSHRELSLKLENASGEEFTMTVYADAPDADWVSNPYAYQIITRTVTSADTLTLSLAPGGGAAVTFLK